MNKLRKSLVVKASGTSRKAKIIKSLPSPEVNPELTPLTLSSVYGKSADDISCIIRVYGSWKTMPLHIRPRTDGEIPT